MENTQKLAQTQSQTQTQTQTFPSNVLLTPKDYLPPLKEHHVNFPNRPPLDLYNIHHIISLVANSVWFSIPFAWWNEQRKINKFYKLFNRLPENFAKYLYELYVLSILRVENPNITDEEARQVIKKTPLQYETYRWNGWDGDADYWIVNSDTDLMNGTPVPPRIYIMIVFLTRLLYYFQKAGLVDNPLKSEDLAIQTLNKMILELEWCVGEAWVRRYINFFYKD